MRLEAELSKSDRPHKKWRLRVFGPDWKRTVHIGQRGASDMTMHKDESRKKLYIVRHAAREDWTIAGVATAGFWSRWLTWNKPTLDASIRDIERRFPIRVRKAPLTPRRAR